MKNLKTATVDKFRDRSRHVIEFYGGPGDETCGVFNVPSPVNGHALRIVASAGAGWDHISVSTPTRCPTWEEMERVKRLFFNDDETAMQLHVPRSDHISLHAYCLHLWRPNDGVEIPRPPGWTVA